jgi:hypothetical protein
VIIRAKGPNGEPVAPMPKSVKFIPLGG